MCDRNDGIDILGEKESPAWPLAGESAPVTDRYRILCRLRRTAVKDRLSRSLLRLCRDVRRQSKPSELVSPVRSRQRESWYSNRLATDPKLADGCAPFYTGRMLVRSDCRRVQKQMLQIGIDFQSLEHTLPYPTLGPTVIPLKNRIPVAEPAGKISPRCTGLCQPDNSIHEPSIVRATATGKETPSWAPVIEAH